MPRKPRKKVRHISLRLILVVLAVIVVLLCFAAAKHWLSVPSLREHRDALMRFVQGRYWESLFLVSAATVAFIVASVPISPPLMLLSGMVFGRWVGSLLMAACAAAGATLALLVVRYLAKDFVSARVRRFAKARRMLAAFKRHQDSYLLFLRFAPGFPFWLTNVLYVLTDIPGLKFALLTLVGVIPDSIIYCNIGANLARVKSAHELLTPGTIAAMALLALLALTPVAIQRLQRRGILHAHWGFGRSR